MNDADLPPLQPLFPVQIPSVVMTCMSEDAIRSMQREAFKAGLRKAAIIAENIRFAMPASPTERAFNTGIESAAKCIRAEQDRAAANSAGGQS